MNADSQPAKHNYDEEGDVLYISFRPGETGMGINLTEHILLRFNPHTKQPVGLTLLDFSVLVSPTEMGPRNFPLTGLDRLPDDLRQIVIDIITTPPVSYYLKVSTFYPSPSQAVPITYVNRTESLPVAA
ncbi:MAG: DUF2283 domain-containing protein [Chloroflexota bacterium]